nr:Hpt domain-containing protein [Desulfuromonadales bacterium]
MIDWNQVRNLCDEIGAEDFGDVVALFLADTDAAIDGLVADDRLAVQLHYLK